MCLKDRISDLPIDVRKHILSFLPTRDAILTSALSKTWRYDWLSLPFLDLGRRFFLKRWKFENDSTYGLACQNRPDPEKALAFLEFVDRAIISKQQTIQKLQLYLPPIHDLSSRIASCLDGLIVNELGVEVIGDSEITNRSRFYYMPMCVLSSNCMTKLYIQGCNLTGISVSEINLPSLCELSVSHVIMDQQVVESLIASCTGVEKLSFTYCQGFRSLEISGLPRLTYLEQKCNRHLEVFQINAENLCSLCHCPETRCQLVLSDSCQSLTKLELIECRLDDGLDIRTCKNLVVLKLLRCGIINEFLDKHFSELSCLEVLEIAFCPGSSYLKITSNHLQSLTIRCDRELEHVEINCPNLDYFTFCTKGCIISLSTETILAPAYVSLQLSVNGNGESTWLVKLLEFLEQLRLSKYLTIETVIIENVIIPRSLRQRYPSPLCQFEHLTLFPQGCVSCLDVTRSIDALLWLCPELKTLSIMDECLGPNPPPPAINRQLTTGLLKMLLRLNYKNQSELSQTICGCNPSLPVNCWRHSLRDFDIIEQHGFEDNDGSLRRFLESAISGM